MGELISVIVPVYKVEKYLERCIESLRNQVYTNLEIILVDDGSPDACGEICDTYQQKDPRIRVIHKANGGLSDARNAGIQVARGKYLGFIDSDDYVAPDMFSHLYGILKDNDADVSICSAVVVEEGKQAQFTDGRVTNVLSGEEILLGMIYQNLFTVNTWNKLYKRELFDKIRFPSGKLYEDLATTYKVMDLAGRVVYSDACKYAYVQRSGSIMNRTGRMMKNDKIIILAEMWGYFEKRERPFSDEIKAGIFKYIINDIFKMTSAGNLLKNSSYRESLKLFMCGKKVALFKNSRLNMYFKLVVASYLCNPRILTFFYSIKNRKELHDEKDTCVLG